MIDSNNHPRHERFRILSLDGGGIKGTFTASALCTLEALTGRSISDHFDLITGTSTGGIIAIAIGMGVPLQDVLRLYVENGPTIFPCPSPGWRGAFKAGWKHVFGPKHAQAPLREAIGNILQERRFGESKNRMVIPAYNAVNGDIQLFKTAHRSEYRMDCQLPAVDIALATSAAPTYFQAFTDKDGRSYVDGGVWANCPAMVGIAEATGILGVPIECIEVLSIGTTAEPFDVSQKRRTGGILHWNRGLIDLIMGAQVQGTLGLAKALLRDRFLRVDVSTRPGRFALDNASEVSELKSLGENVARQNVAEIQRRFLSVPAPNFQPCQLIAADIGAKPVLAALIA